MDEWLQTEVYREILLRGYGLGIIFNANNIGLVLRVLRTLRCPPCPCVEALV